MITPQRLDYIWADFSCYSQEGIPAYMLPTDQVKMPNKGKEHYLNDD